MYYVRAAAAAATRLPREIADEAFLLGLGVALDDSPLLPSTPVIGGLWRQIEPPEERADRLAVLRSPTMRGRHDSAQHFAVSAALAVLVGPQAAEGIGIAQGSFRFAWGQRFQLHRSHGRFRRRRLRHGHRQRPSAPVPRGGRFCRGRFSARLRRIERGNRLERLRGGLRRFVRQPVASPAASHPREILGLAGYAGMPYRP